MQMTKITAAASVAVLDTSESMVEVPLNKLDLADENVRDASDDDAVKVAAMADSMTVSSVRLLNPLVAYEEGGRYKVTAGGRRLRALKLLKKQKRLPEWFANGVAVKLRSKADAVEISFAENAHREPMSEYDEFQSYRKLAAKGVDARTIACVSGGSEKRVAQMLRLTEVSPVVLAAYDDRKLGMDALRSFSVSADHAAQESVLASGTTRAYDIRRALLDASIPASDRLALFVGKDAYVQAGGQVTADLFSDSEYFLNRPLLERLVEEKIEATLQVYRAKGWGEALFHAGEHYTRPTGLSALRPEEREPNKEEAAELERLVAAADAMEVDYSELQEAHKQLRQAKRALEFFSHEAMAGGVMVFALDHNGAVHELPSVHREVEVVKGPGAEKPAFGHEGHQRMTRIATTALRYAVAADPVAAFDCRVAHEAWCLFRWKSRSTSFALPNVSEGCDAAEAVSLGGEDSYVDLYTKWDEALPVDQAELLSYVVGLDQGAKLELFALTTAMQLNGLEHRADQRRESAWGQIGLFAKRVRLNISATWRPDADFLKGAGKKVLLQALTDMDVDPTPYQSMKKTELVEVVAEHAKQKRWNPPLLAALNTTDS